MQLVLVVIAKRNLKTFTIILQSLQGINALDRAALLFFSSISFGVLVLSTFLLNVTRKIIRSFYIKSSV